MIRSDKIKTGLFGGVGFEQPTLSGYNIVDATNLASSSGLKFGDSSELVTIKNIKDCQEDAAISSANFNVLLARMQKSVILDVCNKVIAGQSDFIDSLNLYPYEKSFDETLTPSTNFVGFTIIPQRKNTVCSIPWIELCFDTEKTFNIYLYNTNKPKTPIQTKEVTTIAGEAVIFNLDWIIADDVEYKGGEFKLGYFEQDLDGAKPYRKDFEFSNFKVNATYFFVEPVYLKHTDSTIDVESELSSVDTFGLNIGLDVYTDYTELIIRNKNLFFPAIQVSMHEKVLNLIKYSTRTNSTERIAKELIDFELYGNSKLKIEGVVDKINRSIDQLKKALFYVPKISRVTTKL
jgi:hypothetical protein